MGTKVLSVLALLVAVGTSEAQEPSAAARPTPAPMASPATFAGCSDAAIREIRFAQDVTVDQIRVELADRGTPGGLDLGPVRVEVSAGRFARNLWVAPSAGRALRFSPGLRSDRFRITLDPSFVGQSSTCVARIDLLQGGTIIASVQP